jgi:hypothetical protein
MSPGIWILIEKMNIECIGNNEILFMYIFHLKVNIFHISIKYANIIYIIQLSN